MPGETDLAPLVRFVNFLSGGRGLEAVGAVDIAERKHAVYCAGRFVMKDDARRLAAALERVVNSETADGDELDIAATVGLVNFLRGGTFVIR